MICIDLHIFYISVKVLQPFCHRTMASTAQKTVLSLKALALRAAQAQEAQEALQMKLQAEALWRWKGGRVGDGSGFREVPSGNFT